MRTIATVLFIFLLLVGAAAGQQAKGPRVFIAVDMEGIGDVVTPAQLGPGPEGFEYERFRRLMTAEVNAAIEGALAAGASKITVADSHGNGLNLLVEELNPKAHLIRSWPRPLEMMEGVDGGYDAAMLIGCHASVGSQRAVRAHTISSARFYDLRLNGKHASEAMINAALAGHFGVPVVLVSGDDVMVDEVHRTLDSNIVGVVVKRGIGYHSAENLSPEMVREALREGAKKALTGLSSFKPFTLPKPVRLEISFKNMLNAEVLAYLPIVEREDGNTVAFKGKDIVEVVKFLSFVGNYDSRQ
jgi:D-amino peptidase